MAGSSSRLTYQAVVDRVGWLASILLHTIRAVIAVLVVAAVVLFVAFGLADDWGQSGLVLGGVVGVGIAVLVFIEGWFALDLAKARRLPEISAETWADAARQVATRAASSHRDLTEARGRSRLWRLVKGLWALKSDVDTLADGGLAPAVALGRTLVPTRLLTVAAGAVAAPFLLGFSVVVLVIVLAVD
jgi:hypothetical protein